MNLRMMAAAVLVSIGVFGLPDVSKLTTWHSPPATDAVRDIREPSEPMKKIVYEVGVATEDMSPIDKFWFSQLYMNAARSIEADGSLKEPSVVTTDGIREVHKTALAFVWKGMAANSAGKYPKLQAAVEKALTEAIGDERKKVTPEIRDASVQVLEAIAWVGRGN